MSGGTPEQDRADAAHAGSTSPVAQHAHDGSAHGDAHDDEHGHGVSALGPIDWGAWGAAVLGIASGGLVAAVLLVAIRPG